MTVSKEKDDYAQTVIHSRPESRNGMNPESDQDLVAAFVEFGNDRGLRVAVF